MDAAGVLPKSDLKDFDIGSVIMVGVARPTDLDKFPALKDNFSRFTSTMSKASDRGVSWESPVPVSSNSLSPLILTLWLYLD